MARCHKCGIHKRQPYGRCGGCGATTSELSRMEIDEVSFVERGANQRAHVALWKSDDAQPEKVPIWRLAESLRQLSKTYRDDWTPREAVAKQDEPLERYPAVTTPTPALMANGYPQAIAKALELDPTRYDEFYGVHKLDRAAMATPLEEDPKPAYHDAKQVWKQLEQDPAEYDAAILRGSTP
jgi:hypothetical protein